MSASRTDIEHARKVLIGFLDAMRDWENTHYMAVMRTGPDTAGLDAQMTRATEELKAIFDTFCAPGETDRRRLDGPRFSHPAEYDRQRGTLYEGKADKHGVVFIFQQHDSLGSRFRFTMQSVEGAWKIVRAETFDETSDDWRSHEL